MRKSAPTPARPASALLVAGLMAGLALAGPPAAQAAEELYRWVDDAGQLVISDRPPEPGTPHETLSVKSGRSLSSPAAPGPAEAARSQDEPPAPQGEDVLANPETCRIARENLNALETAGRIQKLGDDGEPYFLSEEEKAIEKDRARSLIRLHCRPGQTSGDSE